MLLVTVLMVALAAPDPRVLDPPRKAYASCIHAFETQSLAAKMKPAAFSEALKGACTAQATALHRALVEFDIAMGAKRAAAMSNATLDVDDYATTAQERYRDIVGEPPE